MLTPPAPPRAPSFPKGAPAKPASQGTVTASKQDGGNSLYLLIALFVAAVAAYLNFAA